MKENQRGFAALEGLLIFLIVAIIGGVGWFVWKSHNSANDSLDNANAANGGDLPKLAPVMTYKECLKSKTSTVDNKSFPKTCTSKAGKKFTDPNPYADWKNYSSTVGKYSLKHPANWQAVVCNPAETDLTLYLGPTKASSAVCSSGKPAQIRVVSTPAVPTFSEQNMSSNTYSDITSKKIVADGVTGKRQSGKLKADQGGPEAIPANTQVVIYQFLATGRSYIIIYIQTPTGDYSSNSLKLFDSMVQNTFKINT